MYASTSNKIYQATEAQLEVWLSSQQSAEATCAYNEISTLDFRGELDVDLLRQSIDKVVSRHESLRSTFSEDGQSVVVHESLKCGFSSIDLSNQNDAQQKAAIAEIIDREGSAAFDLVAGPLFRVILQTLGADHHRLTVTAHHLVLDGWSLAVVCQDLGHFYDVANGKKREPLPPANQYDDYAKKIADYFESDSGQVDERFWVDQFTDEIPVLDLPIELNRPSLRTYTGARFEHSLNSELVERIRLVGAKSGCSLFNAMLAGFSAYVSRISGCNDFCIGIPTAGQAAMDSPELVGHCVNTMPLRNQVDLDETFLDFMKSSRNTLLNAFDHQRYSYGTLLRKLKPPRDPSRPPMLNVSFNIDPVIDANKLGFDGLDVDVIIEPRRFENFEWFINGVILADKSIELQVQYNTDLYTEQAIEFYFSGFEQFLTGIVEDPQTRIADFHLMTIPQRQQVLADWNATSMDYPVASTLHQEFSRQTTETPDRIAVQFEDAMLTYAEVESQSNQIARFLQQQNVSPGDLVGICVNRSERMLVYLYGILKAGAGYVPLDPAYPDDRLQYMCDHSELKLVVTEGDLKKQVAAYGKPQIVIDEGSQKWSQLDSQALASEASPADICYVIYTSGSTGKPKGVQVPHGAVVNFLISMQTCPGFTQDDSLLAVTTLSFDIAVLELYLPTITGGKVVVVDSATAADGKKLIEYIDEHSISLLQATPATWRLLLQADWAGSLDLKVLCGGEPMPTDLVQPLLDRCAELWNMYGPTETTVWSAVYQITNAVDPILIGKPIGNTQLYVLDANGNEVPAGCEGEVYIGGAGVTLGYRNRQDLTDERFVDNRYRNPFADYVSDRLYKTGDLAKYRFDGNLQFLRRNDKQVKVRGFRIELGEIEQNIKTHPSVDQTVVIVREDNPGDARLVCYVISKPAASISAAELKDHLRQSVPYYMVPQHFVELDAMPQTNNGKIDYKALPVPTSDATTESTDVVLPQTSAEKFLAEVWAEQLECDEIGIDDVFFDIGGHSLLVMKVIAKVQEKTGVRLSPQDFLISTLEQMADKLGTCEEFSEAKPLEAANAKKPASTDTATSVAKPEAIDRETKPSRSGFRRLTGFWN
jgi:amino acid adenylation domain-containing protein